MNNKSAHCLSVINKRVWKMKGLLVYPRIAVILLLVGCLFSSIVECHPPHSKHQHNHHHDDDGAVSGLRDDPAPIINTKYGPIKGISSAISNMYLGKYKFL